MRIINILTLLFLFLLLSSTRALALYNPLSVPNNKFGINIIDENDLEDAARLVNSSGGSWGYVNLVITENERDKDRWQKVFDRMRTLNLIPIVRIATHFKNNYWSRPKMEDAEDWANFLNSLNWVIENRYVILFNEPNHAKEWGDQVNPDEYAKILVHFAKVLKEKNENFFILPAGLDASAPNQPPYFMDEVLFISKMLKAEPNVFKYIDGWVSHSYPNPAFSAKPNTTGRISIRTYKWEVDLLKKMGVNKELPVFITETGWSNTKLSEKTIANYYKIAFTKIWSDNKIVTIAPFILNYQAGPFDIFSWKRQGSNDFLPRYQIVQSIPKISGQPKQKHALKIIDFPRKELPLKLPLRFTLVVKNKGESIWQSQDKLLLEVVINKTKLFYKIASISPGESAKLPIRIPPLDNDMQSLKITVVLLKDNSKVADDKITIKLVKPLRFFLANQQLLMRLLDANSFHHNMRLIPLFSLLSPVRHTG